MTLKQRINSVITSGRHFLIRKLGGVVLQDEPQDDDFAPSMISDPEYYLRHGDDGLALVDKDVLASLVMYAVTTGVAMCDEPDDPDEQIISLDLYSQHVNSSIFVGGFTMEEFMELAEDAEVDHIIDFLVGDEWYKYHPSGNMG